MVPPPSAACRQGGANAAQPGPRGRAHQPQRSRASRARGFVIKVRPRPARPSLCHIARAVLGQWMMLLSVRNRWDRRSKWDKRRRGGLGNCPEEARGRGVRIVLHLLPRQGNSSRLGSICAALLALVCLPSAWWLGRAGVVKGQSPSFFIAGPATGQTVPSSAFRMASRCLF